MDLTVVRERGICGGSFGGRSVLTRECQCGSTSIDGVGGKAHGRFTGCGEGLDLDRSQVRGGDQKPGARTRARDGLKDLVIVLSIRRSELG